LAYIAFNTSDFCEFVIEKPTPIIENGEEKTWVYHYSEIQCLEAKNLVISVGKA